MKVRFNGIGVVHKLCHLCMGGGSPKDDLLHRPYSKKQKIQQGVLVGGRGQKGLILRDIVYEWPPMVNLA